MKRQTISILLLPLSLLLFLTSCDKYIYDQGACPTVLVFTPYVQTPCMTDSAYIGQVGQLHIAISDPTSGQIIAHKQLTAVDLSATAQIELPVPSDGGEQYRYTIWVSADPAHYELTQLSGSALPRLTDCTLALRLSPEGRYTGVLPEPLYYATGTVTCPPLMSGSSVRVPVAPNLIRYSNNFNIHLTALPSTVIYPLQVEITDSNAAYDFLGALTNPTKHVIYEAAFPTEGQQRSTKLSTLRIDDPATFPKLSLTRGDTGEPLFTYDLKELLGKRPDYRPECQFVYDLEIRLSQLPDNTHYAITIYIDGWKVHSYEIVL